MAESQSKKRNSDHVRGASSSGRFFKRRRGQWGHSRASINAALAIAPTTAPPAANGGSTSVATSQVGVVDGSVTGQGGLPKQQRHGRKRRRHRHSSFSGGGQNGDKTTSSYSLPPAVAAALAIPPKTPEAPDSAGSGIGNSGDDGVKEDPPNTTSQWVNGGDSKAAAIQSTSSSISGNVPATANGSSGKKKKRRSRRKRRQWKPYYKLTAEERRELEEREEKRAERVRAQRFAHGQPVAPYNTTQFLLRDRELRNGGEPDCGDLDEIVRNIRHHTRSGSYESPGAVGASDSNCEDVSSDNSDYSYLEREFDNDWLDEQRQRLEAMTKDDLVKEFMDLQKQYESAQRDMRSKRLSYEDQIAILQRENNQLRSYYASLGPGRVGNAELRQQDGLGGQQGIVVAETATASNLDDANCSTSSLASTNEPVTVTLSLT